MNSLEHAHSDTNLQNNPMNIELPNTKARRIFRTTGWTLFGVFSLIFFTLFKLPDDRIKSNIDSAINSVLSTKDISFTAGDAKLSFLLGFSYTMKDITLNLRSTNSQAHIDRIQISPSFLPLLLGRYSGSLSLTNGKGTFDCDFSIKNSKVSFSFKSKKLDLGKLGILPILANIRGAAILDGSGDISGDMNVPSTLDGKVALQLKQVAIDAQSIMGFSVPKINVSEGIVDMTIDRAKAVIKAVRLGKTGSNPIANAEDDVQAVVTGDLNLAKDWYSSTMNIKARFSLSETILKAFILLDAILGAGKQSDGSYAFQLTGSLLSPIPSPVAPNGGNF